MKEWERQFRLWERKHRASESNPSWGDYEYLAFKNKIKAVVAFWELQKYNSDKVGTVTTELCEDLYIILHKTGDVQKRLNSIYKMNDRKKAAYFSVSEAL